MPQLKNQYALRVFHVEAQSARRTHRGLDYSYPHETARNQKFLRDARSSSSELEEFEALPEWP